VFPGTDIAQEPDESCLEALVIKGWRLRRSDFSDAQPSGMVTLSRSGCKAVGLRHLVGVEVRLYHLVGATHGLQNLERRRVKIATFSELWSRRSHGTFPAQRTPSAFEKEVD
jgi:hypothetical protein